MPDWREMNPELELVDFIYEQKDNKRTTDDENTIQIVQLSSDSEMEDEILQWSGYEAEEEEEQEGEHEAQQWNNETGEEANETTQWNGYSTLAEEEEEDVQVILVKGSRGEFCEATSDQQFT